MAADAWKVFDLAIEYMADGTIDLDDAGAGIFKCGLLDTTLAPSATDTSWATIDANEITGGTGYTTGGKALESVTWTTTASGIYEWDAADIDWTASGGTLAPHYAVIYHVASDTPIAMSKLDTAALSVTDGNTLTLELNSAGIFTLNDSSW